jgi:hypothetical protein
LNLNVRLENQIGSNIKNYERLEKEPNNEYIKSNIEIYKKEISLIESKAPVTTMYYIPDYEKESVQ